MKINLVKLVKVTSSEEETEKFLNYLKELEFRYNFRANLDKTLSNFYAGLGDL